jgi:hypothetical protein
MVADAPGNAALHADCSAGLAAADAYGTLAAVLRDEIARTLADDAFGRDAYRCSQSSSCAEST